MGGLPNSREDSQKGPDRSSCVAGRLNRFYAPFDGSLDARYAAGRATAIEPYFEPFYKDQDLAYTDGRFGRCVTGDLCLVYDPMRNFTPDRGAVSFWFRPVDRDLWTFFQVHAREPGVGPNSRRQKQ